jgi:hypothetical protein
MSIKVVSLITDKESVGNDINADIVPVVMEQSQGRQLIEMQVIY